MLKPLPKSAAQPSLQDYTNFHGMLCSPWTVKRCINSLNGSKLFLPVGYSPPYHMMDYNLTGQFGPLTFNPFTIWTYYLLVILSFTGMATLLGKTKFLEAKEVNEVIPVDQPYSAAPGHKELRVEPSVWKYLAGSEKEVLMKRRFEYSFGGLVPIRVTMLHIEVAGKLSLVEVYDCKSTIVRWALLQYQKILSFLNGRRREKIE